MANTRCTRSQVLVFISFFVQLVRARNGFNREVCYNTVRHSIENGTLARDAPEFYRDEQGVPMSGLENPVLTVIGCEAICGKSFKWYIDIGPRLSTWLIPVFLLLSNMEVSPLDKRRYLMLLHLLGDPAHSLFCLLLKMEAWSRCYCMARRMCRRAGRQARNLATVLGGFEELIGFYADPAEVYRAITDRERKPSDYEKELVAKAAVRLADSRTDERLRTILAAVLYIYQLISAFIATVGGGNTSPPGGRIGMTMFMTWIIPAVLISNAMGCYTSRRTCFYILDDFVRGVNPETDLWTELRIAVPEIKQYATIEEYFDTFSWSGAIYSYRPSAQLKFSSKGNDRSTTLILLLALAPTVISSIIGSVILWHTPPIGLGCRNMLLFSLVTVFLGSFIFTWATHRVGLQGVKHWRVVLIKDALVAIPSVVLVFLATSGLFNSCRCWSGVYSLGLKAHVPMNPVADFMLWGRTLYPILVATCLSLLIAAFIGMMWIGWRGWNVMRWSEEERQQEWSRVFCGMPRLDINVGKSSSEWIELEVRG